MTSATVRSLAAGTNDLFYVSDPWKNVLINNRDTAEHGADNTKESLVSTG